MPGLLSELKASELVSFIGVLEREGVTAEDIKFLGRYRVFANQACGGLKKGSSLVEVALTAPRMRDRIECLNHIEDPEALRDICLATKGRVATLALKKMSWNYAAMVAMEHSDLRVVSLAMSKVVDSLLDDWIRNWPQGPRRRRAVRERTRRRSG